ncbi:MAG: SAM-dependent methyltransferase [Phototrophicales bacterium]|nr:MAG: SAM-dependent methyltransferase [Phototrophicales bacterium]
MQDKQTLNAESKQMWNAKAAFWDSLHGDEGNRFHRTLVAPSIERLLVLKSGERVLDVACGNGVMARRLAALGAIVTAVDFSAELIERAKARGQQSGHPIDYRVVDATDQVALVALGQFDAIVCTMALMDIPDIAPLFLAARQMLRPEGRFVFATAHPAFNSNNPIFYAEMEDSNGQLIHTRGMKINKYLHIPPMKALGAIDEPNPHYYYHRPLHQLLGEAFQAGLVLNGIEEAAYPPGQEDNRALSWRHLSQIPPVLVGRLIVN